MPGQRPGMPEQRPQKPGMPGQRHGQKPVDLKGIKDKKYIFERKDKLDETTDETTDYESTDESTSDSDGESTDSDSDAIDVPDEPINRYVINDLMHILKDVHHNEKYTFYNILNNDYLYRNNNIQNYISELDDGLFDRYRLFMNRLHTGARSEKQKIMVLKMLTDRDDKIKKRTFKRQFQRN